MDSKLTIGITHHNEPLEIYDALLESIDTQTGINFDDIEVVVSNDSDEPAIIDFSKYRNIERRCQFIETPFKNNIGLSRQHLIDHCNTKYIMFCDCDDMLSNALVVNDILGSIVTGANVYHFDFFEEYVVNGQYRYKEKGSNSTWCFGKVYDVDFLREHDIRFTPKLRYHEDTYFNHCLLVYHPTQESLNMCGYIWKYNPSSITRSNNYSYSVTSLTEYIDSIDYCIESSITKLGQNVTKDLMDSFTYLCYTVIGEIYARCDLNRSQDVEAIDTLERRLAEFIKKYDRGLSVLALKYAKLVNDSMTKVWNGVYLPTETFYDFIGRIMSENE